MQLLLTQSTSTTTTSTSLFCSTLAHDLLKLLNDTSDHDMVICVGGGGSYYFNNNSSSNYGSEDVAMTTSINIVKIFQVHSNILRVRSTYFANYLKKEWIKKENGIIQFRKPNISPFVFEIILKFVHLFLFV